VQGAGCRVQRASDERRARQHDALGAAPSTRTPARSTSHPARRRHHDHARRTQHPDFSRDQLNPPLERVTFQYLSYRSPSLHRKPRHDAFQTRSTVSSSSSDWGGDVGAGCFARTTRARAARRRQGLFKLDLPPEQVHRLVAELERLAPRSHAPSMAAPLAAGMTGVRRSGAGLRPGGILDLSLRQYGPASPADALRIAAQLARALTRGGGGRRSRCAAPADVLTSTDETRLTGVASRARWKHWRVGFRCGGRTRRRNA